MWSALPNHSDDFLPSVARRVGTILRFGALIAAGVMIGGWLILVVLGLFAAWWAVPPILAIAVLIGAFLQLQRPIWGFDVPDGQLWALIGERGQISEFLGAGIHWLTPVQEAIPYTESGLIQIAIALDPVLTADHYPYRVSVALSLVLNPLAADRSEYGRLRQISKQGLIDSLGGEISAQVRASFLQNARNDNAPSVLIDAVKTAIAQIVADYGSLGLSLNTRNAILIDMAPPDEVINARTAQWVKETQTEAGVNHLASMLQMAGGYDVSAGQLGQLHFSLNMQPNTPITFRGMPPGVLMETDASGQSPRLSPRSAAELPPPSVESDPPVPRVINTRQDSDGSYVPSDPILGRKNKKRGE